MHADTDATLEPLRMLAAALAGRALSVDYSKPPLPAGTDGSTIYVEADAALLTQLQQLCAQCALLAAGSLDREVLQALRRRPALAQRYLAIEGPRALLTLEAVLPPFMAPLLDRAAAARSDSPTASLALARGDASIAAPASFWGAIRVRELLNTRSTAGVAAGSDQHAPRKPQAQPLEELADDAVQDDEDRDDASSPVGGGGGIGKLLQRLFDQVRQIRDGGPPGADAPTHRSRSGSRGGAHAVRSSAQAETIEEAFGAGRGIRYPEWDLHRREYRPDWCTVQEIEPPSDHHAAVEWLGAHSLRRPLARLGTGLDRFHRQLQGDDIDIDAAIEAQIERCTGSVPNEASYIESRRHRRDLSVLILLDISGSVMQTGAGGQSIHTQQRDVAAGLVTVLYEIGDRVALYAFSSQGREAVHLTPVKRFDEALDSRTMRRLHSLIPGAYSRLGAAIRHGSHVLLTRGGTARRLLLVLSDGLAYDHGYDASHGAADARKALAEARRDGIGCLCLSVGSSTDSATLKRVFGSAAHATVPRAEQLGALIGPLLRSALRNGEARRRVA